MWLPGILHPVPLLSSQQLSAVSTFLFQTHFTWALRCTAAEVSHACHCTKLPSCNIRLNTGAKLATLCCCYLNHSLAFCAAALSPDKSSLAAEKLKENLRAEGVLEQLVYAAQRHAMQEEEPVATSSQTDADDRRAITAAFSLLQTCHLHFAFACIVYNQNLTRHVVQHMMHKRLPVSGDGPNHIVNHLLFVL